MLEAYGVWVEKSMYGRKYMGVERTTVLIDRDGRIARVWPKVKVPGHAEEVLAAAKKLPGRPFRCRLSEKNRNGAVVRGPYSAIVGVAAVG